MAFQVLSVADPPFMASAGSGERANVDARDGPMGRNKYVATKA